MSQAVSEMAPQQDAESITSLPDRVSAVLTDQTIFLTGGTGFIGKAVVEKFLRKNPNIREIILLIREKKGVSPEDRLDIMLDNVLFDTVAAMRGGRKALRRKIRVVAGDVALPELGMSPADRQYVADNATIILHTAATVRFDEPLRKTILLNTRGTKLVLDLARECKNLKVVMHMSTAYCHPEVKLLEEKRYPSPADPHKVIAAAELLDEDTMEIIAKRLMAPHFPNTYVYSKALGEELAMQALDEGLPIGIMRPSIVVPMYSDPVPGWTDNINGPTGLMLAAGKGVLRSMYGNSSCYADYIPVDILANAVMIAIWDYFTNRTALIVNCTSSAELQVTWAELLQIARGALDKWPLGGAAWYPGGDMTSSRLYHNICLVLFHWLPAIFADAILVLLRYEPVLMRVQRRIAKGREVFEFYTSDQWDFKSDIGQSVRKLLNAREREEYKVDAVDVDIHKYYEHCVMATRRYILKQPDETLPTDRRNIKILYVIDRICKTLFVCLSLWFLFKFAYSFFSNPARADVEEL